MKRVFLYMDEAPRQTGSGAQLRFYSNLRAYVDLGFEAEVVCVGRTAKHSGFVCTLRRQTRRYPCQGVGQIAVWSAFGTDLACRTVRPTDITS